MRTELVLADRRSWLLLATALGCIYLAGCGRTNQPAEPQLAAQSLETALACWKRGDPPATLSQRTPPIVAGDFAWAEGRKLTDYRLIGEARNDGVNLHYAVELRFGDERGAPVEEVTYIVGTRPAITIFRE